MKSAKKNKIKRAHPAKQDGYYKFKGNLKDARLRKSRRPRPFDPAPRDLRMNRTAARFTKSKANPKVHRQDCLPAAGRPTLPT